MGKPRTRWEGVVWRDITDPRNMRTEEMSRRQRGIGASCEESQGPEGAADGWMDGLAAYSL